jgi:hypothetical protein
MMIMITQQASTMLEFSSTMIWLTDQEFKVNILRSNILILEANDLKYRPLTDRSSYQNKYPHLYRFVGDTPYKPDINYSSLARTGSAVSLKW